MQTDDHVLTYIQGRLSPEESAALEARMEHDDALRAEIAALQAARTVLADTPDDLPADGWTRLQSRIDAEPNQASNDNRPVLKPLLQVAAIALVAIIGWQAIAPNVFPSRPDGYTAASAPSDGPTLQVFFNEDVTLGAMTTTLSNLNGTIIDGPSALGRYTVAFPDNVTRDAAFDVLSNRPDLIDDILRD